MRARFVSILSTITLLVSTHTQAQQWNGAFATLSADPTWQNVLDNPMGLPAKEAFLSGIATSCTAGPSVITATGINTCPNEIEAQVEINLNQFARQSDLQALQTQMNAVQSDSIRQNKGIAMSLAMAGVAYLQPDEHIAFSGNWGTFQGQNGGALGVAYRLSDHISVNGGFAASFDGGAYGGRAGFRIGW